MADADHRSTPPQAGFAIYRESDAAALPSPLAAAKPLFAAALAAGLEVTLVVAGTDDATKRSNVKRRHDVKGALRTLEYAVDALRRGESLAPTPGAPVGPGASKIDAVARAVAVLQKECPDGS